MKVVIASSLNVGVVVCLASCSLIFSADDAQCANDADCAERGLSGRCVERLCVDDVGGGSGGGGGSSCVVTNETDGPWHCLGNVSWPPDSMDAVFFSIILSPVGIPDLSGLDVTFCNTLGAACSSPAANGEHLPIAESGEVGLMVPSDFQGYFRITGTDVKTTYVYFQRTVGGSQNGLEISVPILSKALFEQLTTNAGLTADPARGVVVAVLGNCRNESAVGAAIESPQADGATTKFFLQNFIPKLDETQTDASGLAGLFNITAGSVTVEARVVSDGCWIGEATANVEPDALVYLTLEPTPGGPTAP